MSFTKEKTLQIIVDLESQGYYFSHLLPYMSNEKNLGCLGCIEDDSAQFYGDHNKPL